MSATASQFDAERAIAQSVALNHSLTSKSDKAGDAHIPADTSQYAQCRSPHLECCEGLLSKTSPIARLLAVVSLTAPMTLTASAAVLRFGRFELQPHEHRLLVAGEPA